jgi:hypothetical protein
MAEIAGVAAQRDDEIIELQDAFFQQHLPARAINVQNLIH